MSNGQEKEDGTDPLDPCDFVLEHQDCSPSEEWKKEDCDGDGVPIWEDCNDGNADFWLSDGDCDNDGYLAEEDCDDESPDIFPSAEEICDGVDNNCNGEIDENVGITYYLDDDDQYYNRPPFVLKDIGDKWGPNIDSTLDGGLVRGGVVTSVSRGIADATRISKFLLTPKGILFAAKQTAFQLLNPREETRIWNPLSLGSGNTTAFGVPLRIQRHLDTSVTNKAYEFITKHIGLDLSFLQQGQADSPLGKYAETNLKSSYSAVNTLPSSSIQLTPIPFSMALAGVVLNIDTPE